MRRLLQRLAALSPDVLRGIRRGIEKESLRVTPDGQLASTPHPVGLGSALTHPHITTDFSESQLELVTGVHNDIESCLDELTRIHQAVYRHLGDEMMWAASMPCRLPADDQIPIGQYGSSNVGRAKHVYRTGLSNRYGRHMQTISGIHYNFSLPDAAWPLLQRAAGDDGDPTAFRNAAYFGLIRNFRRHAWLPLYLFGASPAVCASFVAGRAHRLQPLGAGTMYLPHGTSLRMGPLGYQSDAQASLAVSYNSLNRYASSLEVALTQPYPPYEAIGITDEEGAYRQLSTSLLQIENEFYGTIRPKRPVRPGERPLHALNDRGIEYVEVRLIDLDPFCPIGICADTMRFFDIFLLHCLLATSADDSADEIVFNARNQHDVAERGRERDLRLHTPDRDVSLIDWGSRILGECAPIATALDAASGSSAHVNALLSAYAALADPSLVPSARVLDEVVSGHDKSWISFARAMSARHRDAIRAMPFDSRSLQGFDDMARASLDQQREIEAADAEPFETYRQHYLAQDLFPRQRA
ncbi:MAG: glutamate--cysteine ligase [Burkholderiaceae bacterium]